ncbi:MAG: hypothetical protein LBE85_02245 [Candidatus Accumulibacter sp.]|jgi:hypothetical protein|nr:hypothetical protein [Accumulibacter sp.]
MRQRRRNRGLLNTAGFDPDLDPRSLRPEDLSIGEIDDLSQQLQLEFSRTHSDRATEEVSYDLTITHIGEDELRSPLVLLLDPGQWFEGGIAGGASGEGDQANLWLIDLSRAIEEMGGVFSPGTTLPEQTVSIVPASLFAPRGTGGSGQGQRTAYVLWSKDSRLAIYYRQCKR